MLIGVDQNIDQRDLNVQAYTYGFESVSVLMKDLMKKPDPELDELSQDLKSKKLSWGVSFLYVEYRRMKKYTRRGLQNDQLRQSVTEDGRSKDDDIY